MIAGRLTLVGAATALTVAVADRPQVDPLAGVPVEVFGDVARPGVVVAPTAGLAVRAAGGHARSNRPTRAGQRLVVDGQAIGVVYPGEPLLLGAVVDLNRAGLDALQSVPGIGPATAVAVLDARPYHAVEELDAVSGLGPKRIAALAPFVGVGTIGPRPPPPRIDVNVADAAALDALPGIGPALAARIVADRAARGPYPTIEALDRVRGIGPATVARLRDRATVGP